MNNFVSFIRVRSCTAVVQRKVNFFFVASYVCLTGTIRHTYDIAIRKVSIVTVSHVLVLFTRLTFWGKFIRHKTILSPLLCFVNHVVSLCIHCGVEKAIILFSFIFSCLLYQRHILYNFYYFYLL